jgi:hypothetical protein
MIPSGAAEQHDTGQLVPQYAICKNVGEREQTIGFEAQ